STRPNSLLFRHSDRVRCAKLGPVGYCRSVGTPCEKRASAPLPERFPLVCRETPSGITSFCRAARCLQLCPIRDESAPPVRPGLSREIARKILRSENCVPVRSRAPAAVANVARGFPIQGL